MAEELWCDWCAEEIDGAPIWVDGRVYCCLECRDHAHPELTPPITDLADRRR